MRPLSRVLAGIGLLVVVGAKPAWAVDGPGIGNLTYPQADLFKEVSLFGASNFAAGPTGSDVAILHRGYLLVLGTNDSGVSPGFFHVFNVLNPRMPVQVKSFGANTNLLREQHAMPIAMVGGRDYLAAPTTVGIEIWDVTDPTAMARVSGLTLNGAQGGDYDNAVWMLTWTWPYLFAGGTQNGVYIIDTRNPAQPTLLNRIPIQSMGNFRVGGVFAMGNELVAMTQDAQCSQSALNCANPATINQLAVLDVGDPLHPALLATSKVPFAFYAGLALGDRIYLGGDFGQVGVLSWSPTQITLLSQKSFANCPTTQGNACAAKGGYVSYQDGFIFSGQSEMGFIKLDVHDAANEASPTLVAHGDLTDPGADTDFSSVFGNMVYIGNDHGSGAGLVPHDTRPDTFPPKLIRTFPADGATMQPLGTRVTIHLSDVIDSRSVNADTFTVRPLGGAPLAGNYSMSSVNAISFGASAPLLPNTTYEVTLTQGGVRDILLNPIATAVTARFSTGTTVDQTTTDAGAPVVDAGARVDASVDMGGGTGTAGSSGTGGAVAGTGGSGATGAGGGTGTGGSPMASGSGGSTGPSGTGGQSPPPAGGGSSSSGCGCDLGGGPMGGAAGLVAMLSLFLLGTRRRRTSGK
jgi:MYXO-CTERM domain-containing protein